MLDAAGFGTGCCNECWEIVCDDDCLHFMVRLHAGDWVGDDGYSVSDIRL
jgi:hypothetical protein